jgi:DNA (cytosine-5)-methyltransferase 1
MWPEAARAVRELRPRIAVFENVYGVLDYLDGEILPEIESEGYQTETVCIPASALGAAHERKRWWVIAYAEGVGQAALKQGREDIGKCGFTKPLKWKQFQFISARDHTIQHWQDHECLLTGNNDGIPSRVDAVGSAGNAVVPQCAEVIFNLPVFNRWRRKERS